MIFEKDYSGAGHPAQLILHKNLEVIITKKHISPYCRDAGFFCDEKDIVLNSHAARQSKKTFLDETALRKQGFKLHSPIKLNSFYEGGDLVSTDKTLYVSKNYLLNKNLSESDVKSGLERISNGREIIFVSNGPAYHLDTYFAPLNEDVIAIGDLAAGKEILKENGISLTESECFHSFVSDYLGLSFSDRQGILDNMEQSFSKLKKVFRVPLFSFTVNGHSFLLSPLNLLSTDTKLWMPNYNFTGYDQVREKLGQISEYVGKQLIMIGKQGAYGLKDASIHCLVGNMERTYDKK